MQKFVWRRKGREIRSPGSVVNVSHGISVCQLQPGSEKATKTSSDVIHMLFGRTHPVCCGARLRPLRLSGTVAPLSTQHVFKFSTQMLWDILLHFNAHSFCFFLIEALTCRTLVERKRIC